MNRLTTLSTRALGVAAALLASVALAGCSLGFDNMGQGFSGSFGILGLIILVLDVLAILQVWQSSRDTGSKVVWTLVIFFLPLVGLILYYLLGRK